MTEIDRALQAHLVDEVYLPLVAHLTLFGLLLTLVWSEVPRTVLMWWGGAIVGVSSIRPALWNAARRGALQPRRVGLIVRATMLALGLAWGVGAAVAFRYLPVADAALILLGLTGLLAGGLATLVADRWTFPIYAIAMFVPPTIVVAVTGPGLFDETAVLLMIIYLAFAIRLHLRSHDSLRKRLSVEAALAQSERYHRALTEEALDLTTLVDADGFVRYASPSYRSVLGYAPEHMIGQRVFDFVHPDDLAATLDIFAEGSATPHATRAHEFRFRHHDGSWRVIAAVGRNLFDDPVIHAAIVNGRDVTDQKTAAEHERTLLVELQRAVSEVRVLQGILPICANCKRIRGDDGSWEAVESYVRDHTNAEFSHGLCPDCVRTTWR